MATKLKPANDTYTVGWITATRLQTAAAEGLFDQGFKLSDPKDPGDSNEYLLGRMGNHNVVVAQMPSKERGSFGSPATKTVSDMMRTFERIRVVFFVGTGSGVYSKQHPVRLGDVAVSYSGLFQYDYDATVQARKFQKLDWSTSAPGSVKRAADSLWKRYMDSRNHLGVTVQNMIDRSQILKERGFYNRPEEKFDLLYKSDYQHRQRDADCYQVCGSSDLVKRPPVGQLEDIPAVHLGAIASADKSIRNAKLRDELAEDQGVLCFESEAAGLLGTFPSLLIRGITDYADTHASNKWQGYAVIAASVYAQELLFVLNPDDLADEKTLQKYVPVDTEPDDPQPVKSQPVTNPQPATQPTATAYQELVGHFPKSEVDAAIRRDKKGLQDDLLKLVDAISTMPHLGDTWKPVVIKLEDFQKKWQITQPKLREGSRVTRGRSRDDWQKMRSNGKLSKQTRFFAAHNEFVAFANGTCTDKSVGFGSLQCMLWSVWRMMEYVGVAEDMRL